MEEDNKKDWRIMPVCVALLVIAILAMAIFIVTNTSSGCEDCFHIEGYFSGIKNNGTFIVVNSYDYFISDWFTVGGDMPYYINSYVGHNVSIDYMAGCGRRHITSFELLN